MKFQNNHLRKTAKSDWKTFKLFAKSAVLTKNTSCCDWRRQKMSDWFMWTILEIIMSLLSKFIYSFWCAVALRLFTCKTEVISGPRTTCAKMKSSTCQCCQFRSNVKYFQNLRRRKSLYNFSNENSFQIWTFMVTEIWSTLKITIEFMNDIYSYNLIAFLIIVVRHHKYLQLKICLEFFISYSSVVALSQECVIHGATNMHQ